MIRHQRPLRVAALLTLAVAAGAQQNPKKGELRASDPPWALAGKTTVVRLYGQDLAPKEIRFAENSLAARILKADPYAGKTDEEKRRGNTVVEVEVMAPPNQRPGLYPFRLVPETGEAVEGRLLIDVEAPEIAETEPNDSFRKPQLLPPGSVTVNGKLDNEGVDVFRIEGKAGETWRFELFARRLRPSTQLEAVLRLRDPRLASVRLAVDYGNDCAIEYRLPSDGPYLLELFDGDNRGNPEFAYRLAVRRL